MASCFLSSLAVAFLGLAAGPCRGLGFLGHANQVVVVDELVAIGDQQIRRRALDAAAEHALVVFLELRDQRRKVAVARDQGEDVDVLLRVAQVERVDDHADVGAVLAAHLALRDVDQFDALGVELAHRVAVVAPVAVGPLEDDPAFFQQPLQDQLDLELARPSCARTPMARFSKSTNTAISGSSDMASSIASEPRNAGPTIGSCKNGRVLGRASASKFVQMPGPIVLQQPRNDRSAKICPFVWQPGQ